MLPKQLKISYTGKVQLDLEAMLTRVFERAGYKLGSIRTSKTGERTLTYIRNVTLS